MFIMAYFQAGKLFSGYSALHDNIQGCSLVRAWPPPRLRNQIFHEYPVFDLRPKKARKCGNARRIRLFQDLQKNSPLTRRAYVVRKFVPLDKRPLEVPQTCINTGFFQHFNLFKLGVSFVVINYICLSFIQIHAAFYFDYINYSGLLIFCCQNVATSLL